MDFLTTRLAVIENDLRREGRLNQAEVIKEARVQIAGKDMALDVLAERVKVAEAALLATRVYVQRAVNQFYNTESAQEDLAAIDAALSMPAREPQQKPMYSLDGEEG